MKNRIKQISMLALVIALAGIYASCENEELPNNGEPRIRYVRLTDPVSSDSLLVSAYQGNLIAIIGENLQDAQRIWFNDQQSVLTSTYITNTTILVSVPSVIPKEITNKIKIEFRNGTILEHDFIVAINEPEISSMYCEYVFAGEEATINGNYFYEPLTVTFTGGATAEVVSVTDEILTITVPAGAQPGPITVTTNFGTVSSDFWFRDNRNIVVSSDPFTGWWNSNFVVSAPAAGDPPAINGNYIRVKQSIGAWNWLEVAGGPPSAMGDISKNIPDEAILKPANYYLKFEVNTMKPYNSNMLKLNFGLSKDFNNDAYLWTPPYDTEGAWKTVVIPFEEVTASYVKAGSELSVSADGYYTRVLFHGAGDLDADISFDNFRVVPKVLKK